MGPWTCSLTSEMVSRIRGRWERSEAAAEGLVAGALHLPRQGCARAGSGWAAWAFAGPSAQKGRTASCPAAGVFKCDHFCTRGPRFHVQPGIHT